MSNKAILCTVYTGAQSEARSEAPVECSGVFHADIQRTDCGNEEAIADTPPHFLDTVTILKIIFITHVSLVFEERVRETVNVWLSLATD